MSFMSDEAVGGGGGKPAANDNGGVALVAVDEVSGSFSRHSSLIFVAGGTAPTQRGDWLTAVWPPRPPAIPAPTAPSGNLQTSQLLHLLLFTTTTLWEVNTPAANYCGFTQPDVNYLLRKRWWLLDCLWSLTRSLAIVLVNDKILWFVVFPVHGVVSCMRGFVWWGVWSPGQNANQLLAGDVQQAWHHSTVWSYCQRRSCAWAVVCLQGHCRRIHWHWKRSGVQSRIEF